MPSHPIIPSLLTTTNKPGLGICTLDAVHEKLYEGCFPDDPDDRDLERWIWSKPDVNDVESCIITCRHHGYVYAGLQVK